MPRPGAHAQPQSRKILRPNVLDNRPQAVVAARAALGPKAKPAQGQVHVVHNHQQVARVFQSVPCEAAHAATALVHKRLRRRQEHRLAFVVRLGDERPVFLARHRHAQALRQNVRYRESHIMPRSPIPRPRIA